MAIVINTPQSHTSLFDPQTVAYTCGASDNMLVFGVSTDKNPFVAPTVTYNGVGMSGSGNFTTAGDVFKNILLGYLLSPPTGSAFNGVSAYGGSNGTAYGLALVSLSGVDITHAPTFGAGSGSTAVTANATTTAPAGAGIGDVQFGAILVRGPTCISNGSNQVNLVNIISAGDTFALDYILGSNPGSFSWNLGSANTGGWEAITMNVFAPVVPTNYSLESSEYF